MMCLWTPEHRVRRTRICIWRGIAPRVACVVPRLTAVPDFQSRVQLPTEIMKDQQKPDRSIPPPAYTQACSDIIRNRLLSLYS